ncbi:LuxR C-terminal-related transcriptional regulator [Amycolatopsis anabasis]|uniref:LuxR C-terminal-related transcriptional regulator n=1 Tax=Amycolatopsis anabasis TaxID=1840409 RepID=UPI001C552954|nr:LuxR C-terminal-related transcriptional regulator [Amycolatopsis anabasis]
MPADLTSFVGRRHDVVAVRQLLATARLVTLSGIGGVGKTRLAYRVAADARRAFPDGVCLVELAALEDPALLPHTVLDALAVREQSSREPVEVLCEHLRASRTLVVLDNCEHLVAAVADLADAVLRAAPDVRILATSRQSLQITGEHVYAVAPLPVPDADEPFRPGTATQYPAVALLVERAAAAVPGFALTADNEAAVVRLCRRLEGIPLAIELAAVRLRVLSVDDLLRRLDDRFALLRERTRNLPERHQTLQALIDWSHDLCTPAERALWARASVFAGGCGIEALEAVCADESLPAEVVLDTVAGLLDKSIFTREAHTGHARFRMLETVRAYGQAQLAAAGEEAVLERRHRDWCLRLFEVAGDEWVGPRQQEWTDRLLLEHANLRRALEYSVSQPGEARVALRLSAMPWFWGAIASLAEGKLWLDRALALDGEPSHERAWALATVGYLAAFLGDGNALATFPERAHDLARQLDDTAALAYATHVMGMRQALSPDPASAIPLFTEALELYERAEVQPQYSDSLRIELGATYIFAGDVDAAALVLDELFEHCSANGDQWNLSYALWGKGFVELLRGEHDRAEADLCEALKIKRVVHDTLGMAFALEVLAWTAVVKSETKRAAILFGGAEKLWQGIGARQFDGQRKKYESLARKQAGDAAFDAAFEQGIALPVEELLALALRERVQKAPESAPRAAALTRRQREVAELVAAGLSNKEIAKKLVISLRTAEGHVESILTKLDFTTRTQIASWFVRQSANT